MRRLFFESEKNEGSRWSSTYEILERCLTICDHFQDLEVQDVDDLLPSTVLDRKLETLCAVLRRLHAVII